MTDRERLKDDFLMALALYFPREVQTREEREAAWQSVKTTARALLDSGSGEAPPRDDCAECHGARGGVHGNENAVLLCDYCHADMLKRREAPTEASAPTEETRECPGSYREGAESLARERPHPPNDALQLLYAIYQNTQAKGWLAGLANQAIASIRAERQESEARLADLRVRYEQMDRLHAAEWKDRNILEDRIKRAIEMIGPRLHGQAGGHKDCANCKAIAILRGRGEGDDA